MVVGGGFAPLFSLCPVYDFTDFLWSKSSTGGKQQQQKGYNTKTSCYVRRTYVFYVMELDELVPARSVASDT